MLTTGEHIQAPLPPPNHFAQQILQFLACHDPTCPHQEAVHRLSSRKLKWFMGTASPLDRMRRMQVIAYPLTRIPIGVKGEKYIVEFSFPYLNYCSCI